DAIRLRGRHGPVRIALGSLATAAAVDDLLDHLGRHKRAIARRELEVPDARPGPRPPSRAARWWRTLGRVVRFPRERASVPFLVLPDRVVVVRRAWLSLGVHVAPMTRLRLRELVAGLHRLVATVSNGNAPGTTATVLLEEISRALGLPKLL